MYQWCSVCNDFGGTMVLCAGCRVAVCSGTADDTDSGCLEYDEAIEDDDFVYYCRFCNERGNVSEVDVGVYYLPYTLLANAYRH